MSAARPPLAPAAIDDRGLVALYAGRALDRGADPRSLATASRALRAGIARPAATERAPAACSVGRGTADHRLLLEHGRRPPRPAARPVPSPAHAVIGAWRSVFAQKPARLAATAALIALLALPLAALVAGAEEVPALAAFQTRYVVQPGDTLADVAAEFGVDPAAILASSAIANAPELTANEIIVIPIPTQTPEEAIADAQARRGTSPYVLGAHTVAPGDTIGDIAYRHSVDPAFLAEFNGVPNVEDLRPGQRLLIPASYGLPGPLPTDGAGGWDAAAEALGGWTTDPDPVAAVTEWVETANAAPVDETGWTDEAAVPATTWIDGVPTYLQRYGLSCEYAAGYIMTAAFGTGIDEEVFRANIGPSPNPHWGYRGWIDGRWGGTDDYGVYPEAMVPILEANGFVADVFYAQGDASALTARLDGGMPVAVWLGYWGDTGVTMDDAGTYELVPGMHVVVAHGYDAGGVHVSDPGTGTYRYFTWGDFMTMWGVLDGMALGVAPA